MKDKRQDIELLRIISTFLIVWYHSGIAFGHEVALSGLVIFLMISMYLSGIREYTGSLQIRHRAERLLVPWLIWFAIYGAKNLFVGKPFIPYAYVEYLVSPIYICQSNYF